MSLQRVPPTSDFESIRKKYLKEKVLFHDPDFPAIDSSVYYSKKPEKKITWKRPHEILQMKGLKDDPKFILGCGCRFDLKQNDLADCWALAGAAAVCDIPNAFFWLVPPDQGFDPNWYAGIFAFRFWQYGKWVEVYVDDQLPTINGDYLFTYSESNIFWGCLLEKAYAKLYGSYEALEYGHNGESLADFTGGLVEYYYMNEVHNLRRTLRKGFSMDTLASATIFNNAKVTDGVKDGLVLGHAYTVTGFGQVKAKDTGKQQFLVRIRNPWGNEVEWTGSWSDKCPMWETITEDSKKELEFVKREDGEFWMSLEDFKKNFGSITLCNFTPDSMDSDTTKDWKVVEIHGKWEKGVSDGGKPVNESTFKRNMQYPIKVEDCDNDDIASVIVQVMQKNVRKLKHLGKTSTEVGFMVIRKPQDVDPGLPLSYKLFNEKRDELLVGLHYGSRRDVTKRFDIDPGEYVVIPTTKAPHKECEYMLRIFSEAGVKTINQV